MDTDNSAEAANIVHATINGVAVEGQKNETILHCARRYDIYIPTLCELDDIDHTPGTCRICLVEIRDSRSIALASCDVLQYATFKWDGCSDPLAARARRTAPAGRVDYGRPQPGLRNVHTSWRLRTAGCRTVRRAAQKQIRGFGSYQHTRDRYLIAGHDPRYDKVHSLSALCSSLPRRTGCRCPGDDRYRREHGGRAAQWLVTKGFDCVTCGQCVLVCPTGAIGERDETDKVSQFLYDPDIITVFQFAPALRVAFGEEFGLPPGQTSKVRLSPPAAS